MPVRVYRLMSIRGRNKVFICGPGNWHSGTESFEPGGVHEDPSKVLKKGQCKNQRSWQEGDEECAAPLGDQSAEAPSGRKAAVRKGVQSPQFFVRSKNNCRTSLGRGCCAKRTPNICPPKNPTNPQWSKAVIPECLVLSLGI